MNPYLMSPAGYKTNFNQCGVFKTFKDFYYGNTFFSTFKNTHFTLDRPELLEDPRFDTNIHRCENYAALKPEIEKWSSQHTIQQCVDIIDAAGVPVAPINMLADVVNDDHIANAREMFVHLQHPVIGDMIVPGNPVKLMDTKPEINKCAPDLGQDNKAIYEGMLGLSDADLAKLKEEKVI